MTVLVNLMFRKLDKFDGPIFGEGGYIRDVNWITYLGAYIRGADKRGGINRVLRYDKTIVI